MTQTFLLFEADATASYISWHMSRHPEAVGYYLGCPPFLQGTAEAEGWTYKPPHIYEVTSVEE